MSAIESSVERAIARLAARPDPALKCWSCGHEAPVALGDPLKTEYRCDECGAVTAYGEPMPRVSIVPHVDRRFLVTRYEQGEGKPSVDIVLARGYATELAVEILSVTEPSLYRALETLFKAGRGPGPSETAKAQGGSVPADGGGLRLDSPGRRPGSVPPHFP